MAKKKAGDQRGAVMALKQMKMYEGELTKLDGQQIMLEQQKMTIQSTRADNEVVDILINSNKVIRNMNDQMDVDSIADLQDEIAENMQEVVERQELFAGVAEDGKDELLAELDLIEADALANVVDDMPVPAAQIIVPDPADAPLQPVAAKSDAQQMQMLSAGMV